VSASSPFFLFFEAIPVELSDCALEYDPHMLAHFPSTAKFWMAI
jgi:hypothetical protein